MNKENTMKNLSTFALVAMIGGGDALARDAVLPARRRNTEGEWVNFFPFGSPTNANLTWYQQVYGERELTDLVGTFITSVAFRVDGRQKSVRGDTYTFPELVIRMSTTDKDVDGLSASMSDNVGDDLITVYDGAYTLPELRGVDRPNPFDYLIEFQEPFFYPGGNLLLDVPVELVFEPDKSVPLDADWTNTDTVSRAYMRSGRVTVDTFGLVTKFVGVVPAPATLTPAVLAVGLACARRRRAGVA